MDCPGVRESYHTARASATHNGEWPVPRGAGIPNGKESTYRPDRNRTDGHATMLRYNAFAPEGDKNKDREYKHQNLSCITLHAKNQGRSKGTGDHE